MYDTIDRMMEKVWSDDIADAMEATTYFTRLIAHERARLWIDAHIIKGSLVPRLVFFLEKNNIPQLQYQAAVALTNITLERCDCTKAIIENDGVFWLANVFYSSDIEEVRGQVIWALGNIATHTPEARDLVLTQGILTPLLKLMNQKPSLSFQRISARALANLFYGNPSTTFIPLGPALYGLRELMKSDDEQVLAGASRALCNLAYSPFERLRGITQLGFSSKLVSLLSHPCLEVFQPALITVGFISGVDEDQIQLLIDAGVLPVIFQLLQDDVNRWIRKDVCWVISNITAGNINQIQAVIETNMFSYLINLLKDAVFEVKKEIAYIIRNVTTRGSREQIRFLVRQGCIKPVCDAMMYTHPMTTLVCLESLHYILALGEVEKIDGGTNTHAQMIYQCEGLEKIARLKKHGNQQNSQMASSILDNFFSNYKLKAS